MIEVCPGVPSYGTLRPGDQIARDRRPAGHRQRGPERAGPGTRAGRRRTRHRSTRDGTTEDLEVRAGRVGTGGSGCTATRSRHRWYRVPRDRGAVVRDATTFPIDVTIDTARVGGPSAGARVHARHHRRPHSGRAHRRQAGRGHRERSRRTARCSRSAVWSRRRSRRTPTDVDLMLVPMSEVGAARRGADGMRVVGVGRSTTLSPRCRRWAARRCRHRRRRGAIMRA